MSEISLICKTCGETYTIPNYRRGKSKYCSRKCAIGSLLGGAKVAWNNGFLQLSPEARKKIGDANRGRKWTEERRERIATARRENPYIPTAEHRKKIGDLLRAKNGIKKCFDGYVHIYQPNGHPNADRGNYVLEHHLIMEKHLGRFIKNGECIHHLNGDKSDNRIENLVLCGNASEHTQLHQKMERFVFGLIKNGKVDYDKTKQEFILRENN